MHVQLKQYCTFDYYIKCQTCFDALCTGYFHTNVQRVQVDKTPASLLLHEIQQSSIHKI